MFIQVMSKVYYKPQSLVGFAISKYYQIEVTLYIVFTLAITIEHIVNTQKYSPISRATDNEPQQYLLKGKGGQVKYERYKEVQDIENSALRQQRVLTILTRAIQRGLGIGLDDFNKRIALTPTGTYGNDLIKLDFNKDNSKSNDVMYNSR